MTPPLVHGYDPAWIDWFGEIERRLDPCFEAGARAIEHVGSTSIPGLAAKPIIDIVIVIEPGAFTTVREALARLGYEHRGDQGVPAREVFKIPDPGLAASLPAHHLYVCEERAPPLRSHRIFRDFLRERPRRVEELSLQKLEAARRAGHDRKVYMALKAPAYAQVIAEALLLLDD